MTAPRATYRLQMGSGAGFAEARAIVSYLERLGISHLYVSPIWHARAGSPHGYDVIDPTSVDPRLGSREDLDELVAEVKRRDMGIVCDVVPNHMAASQENRWWWDVLSEGAASRYAALFDIDWDHGDGRLVLPVLGAEPEDVIGEMRIDRRDGGPVLRYHEHAFPLRGDVKEPSTAVLDRQPYRLMFWREGERRVNYRRFFDINELAATRMDDPSLFEETHQLVFELARAGAVDGIRVDHIDGLRDPPSYLERLSERLPPDSYVVVEKILARDEALPQEWVCAGTTGYEFADLIESAAVDRVGAERLRSAASRFTGVPQHFGGIAARAKRDVLEALFASELDALTARCVRIAGGKVREGDMREALAELTVALDVYRTYVNGSPARIEDRSRIERALRAVRHEPARAALSDILLADREDDAGDERAEAIARWQQLCVPVAAKGVEDTALYRFVPLTSRSEVGAAPDEPSIAIDDLHTFFARRADRSPAAMSASSTHDSKRSEDVRARIDVLSEIPDRWINAVEEWHRMHAPHRGGSGPDATDEWLLYQTLVGTWPLSMADEPNYRDRIAVYMRKAAREAKRRTDWRDPDEDYEAALERFISAVIADTNGRFHQRMDEIARFVAVHGAVNSLARLVLKGTAPGVPDFYQGTETWHLRLVDPDNREPVDHAVTASRLDELIERHARDPVSLARDVVRCWADGRIKLLTTWRVLRTRRDLHDVFASGAYLPLDTRGAHDRNVIAFARTDTDRWVVVCVPRLSTQVVEEKMPCGDVWGSTRFELPRDAPSSWRNAITDEAIEATEGSISLTDALRIFPVAVLLA